MRRMLIGVLAASLTMVGVAAPATANPNRGAPAPGNETIAEVVIASAEDGEFTQLLDALLYTDLAGTFARGGQYTVFAPTDAAFDDLYDALGVDSIRDLPPELVTDVLLYHVTPGRRAANSVVPPVRTRSIGTLLDGASLQVDRGGSIHTIAGQSVPIAAPNAVSAKNGVIHVIGEVLLPLG